MSNASAAARLVALHRMSSGARPPSLPPAIAVRSEAAAYQVQAAVAGLLGADVGGWKISPQDATHGLAAAIFTDEIHPSPAQLGPAISALTRGNDQLGIEPEVAFTLQRDLPARDTAYSREELLDAIDAAHAAFEILSSRFASHEGAAPLDRLADRISNAGLVLGPPCRDWRRLEFGTLALTFEIDAGEASAVHRLQGGHPIGDPILAALWLVNAFARSLGPAFGDRSLRAGDVLTTGSFCGLHYLPRGGRAAAEFRGLGRAEVLWGAAGPVS